MFWKGRKKSGESGARPTPARGAAPAEASAGAGPARRPATEFLTGDGSSDRRTVELLLGAIARVSESRDIESLLVDIVDRSIEVTGAERGFLILAPQASEPIVRVARSRSGENLDTEERFSTSVVRGVLQTQQPKLATVSSDSAALELGQSVYDLKLRAVMCVPLAAEPGVPGTRGVLYVDSRAATRQFDARDLGLFAALSQHISIALTNARLHLDSLEKARLEQSLELASAIQSGLMPPVPRDWSLDVHGWYRPAERTSGDFYDFVRTRDGRMALVMGDVTGHGIGPALLTAAVQASLRSYLRVLPDPCQALTLINQDLCERADSQMFVTVLLALFTADGRLEVSNAGHHPVVVARAHGIAMPARHGPALGLVSGHSFEIDERVQLDRGDLALIFSDGLIEARSASDTQALFGLERAIELLKAAQARGESAELVARGLAQAALEFAGPTHEDDITLVVARRP
jgi:serine phosphatase RsbU (regulator of sigma subunit)